MISVLWPLPLPIAPSRLCPSLFTAVAHRPCPFLWVPVFYMWRSKYFDRSMGGELWGREHGTWGKECGDGTVTQFFSGCVLSKIFVYGDGKMMLWFCGCLLSKNVITWFAHHCCLSPLPVAFALRLCQSMLPVNVASRHPLLLLISLSASFLHTMIKTFLQEHGKGNVGT